ncbi:MAG TPA: hypothetical protein DEB39_16460 [Planctomycetaceae bacterium]|nr:hypothetical protein [Planctomycetaceae bacterium]
MVLSALLLHVSGLSAREWGSELMAPDNSDFVGEAFPEDSDTGAERVDLETPLIDEALLFPPVRRVAHDMPTPAKLSGGKLAMGKGPVAKPRQLPGGNYREMVSKGTAGRLDPPMPPKTGTKRLPDTEDRPFSPRIVESDETSYITNDTEEEQEEGRDEQWDPADEIPKGLLSGDTRFDGNVPEVFHSEAFQSEVFPSDEFMPQEGAVYDAATLSLLSMGGLNGAHWNGAHWNGAGLPSDETVYEACPRSSLLDNLSINLGVTGFKNQIDLGQGGNFGFAEGFNWAAPITPLSTVSGQFGFRSQQTTFTGSEKNASSRTQYYITAGIFRRGEHTRFQGGIAYDWFQDNDADKVKLEQLRTELSYRTRGPYEFGFLGGIGVNKVHNRWVERYFRRDHREPYLAAACYYSFFGRKNFACGGTGMIDFGFTEYGDSLLGGKFELPINDKLEMKTGFTLMIPKAGGLDRDREKESWNLGIAFIYHFRGGAFYKQQNPFRPMFDVADPGSFFPRIGRE